MVKLNKLKLYWEKNNDKILAFIYVIMISVAALWSMSQQNRLKIVDDEFGYWGIAAHMAGYDWSDLMAATDYYSFGYSLVLLPIYFLTQLGVSAVVTYQIAIVMNAIFLILSFFLAVYVGKRILPDINKFFLLTACFAVTVFTANIGEAGIAWTEVYLYFMFWCLTACIFRLIERFSIGNIILVLMAAANLFIIHMRALGVVIAVVLTLLICLLRNIKRIPWKSIIIILAGALALTAAVLVIMELITRDLYQISGGNVNTFPEQAVKIRNILSLSGLVDLSLSVLGKLYYLGVSTFLFIFIGFTMVSGKLVSAFWQMKQNKKINISNENIFHVFLILSFLGTVMVSAIFKIFFIFTNRVTMHRGDEVMFGRYSEFMMGPLLLIGLTVLLDVKKYIREISVALFVLFICSIAVQYQLDFLIAYNEAQRISLRRYASMGITWLFNGEWRNFAYSASGIITFIFGTAALMVSFCTKKRTLIGISSFAVLLLSGFWIYQGIVNLQPIIDNYVHRDRAVDTVVDLIDVFFEDEDIYFVTKNRTDTDIKILQWMRPNLNITLVKPEEVREMLHEGGLFISNGERRLVDFAVSGPLFSQMNYLYNSGSLDIFSPTVASFDTDLTVIEALRSTPFPRWHSIALENMLPDHGEYRFRGHICYVPVTHPMEECTTVMTGVRLADGIYEFVIEIEAAGYNDGEIGYVTIGTLNSPVSETRALKPDDFLRRGKGKITFTVEVMDRGEVFLEIYTHSGNTVIAINAIEYRQIRGNAIAGLFAGRDHREELMELGERYAQDSRADKVLIYVDSDSSGSAGFPDLSVIAMYFGDILPKYLPGNFLPFLEGLPGTHLLVEKTGRDEALYERMRFVSEHTIIGMSENYYLLSVGGVDKPN